MDKKDICRSVRKLRREYGLKEISAPALKSVFEKQGFTVIYFNPVNNDEDVSLVINSLGLSSLIMQTDGFIYTDRNYRLLFISDKLTETEQMHVMAHEEGHYYLGHSGRSPVVGRSVTEEFEANEFAHYLLQPGISGTVRAFLYRRGKVVLLCAAVLLIAGAVFFAAKEQHERSVYEGDFYVTEHGEKYHRKDCVTIQGHETRRLTKEDVKQKTYEPCSVCRPDE